MTETYWHAYAVGKPYAAGRTSFPETVQYNYRGGEHELVCFWRNPSRQEIAGVTRGRAGFGLLIEGDVVFLLYQFNDAGVSWSDAPYSIHRVADVERDEPPVLTGDERSLLHVIVVDAASGLIVGMRQLAWSPAFSAAVNDAIRAQLARPYPGDGPYQRQIDAVYRRMDSPAMARAATAKTMADPDDR